MVFVGSGVITRDELSSFYSSVLGLDTLKVGQILDVAYQAMTSVIQSIFTPTKKLFVFVAERGPSANIPRISFMFR